MPCLLFCFGCCGTGVEDNAEKITPESATEDHLKRKAKKQCRFLRGAGFGNLVERFFENPCRFFALHVAVRRQKGELSTVSRCQQRRRSKSIFKKSQNQCRFGGSKVAVGW